MSYTVISVDDDNGHLGSGLTLTEAFVRLMALAYCDYLFHRVNRVMYIEIEHHDQTRDAYIQQYKSHLADDAMARMAIMRDFVRAGFGSFCVVTDELWRQDEARTLMAAT